MQDHQINGISDEEVIRLIKENEASLARAIEGIYLRKDLRKTAFSVFQKYKNTLALFEWEDIFGESIIRMVLSVLYNKFRSDSGLNTFFSSICNNYCKELIRKNEKRTPLESDWTMDPEQLVFDEEIETLLKNVLEQQTDQCKKIYKYLFFYSKAWSMEDIAEELGLGGSRSAITTYYRCKQKLIAYIDKNERLSYLIKSYL